MKNFWDIDIDDKTATFKEDGIVYKIKFDVELDEHFVINTKEVLENNNAIDLSKMHTYIRYLGDEMSLLFYDKLVSEDKFDCEAIKLFCLDDNIYIDDCSSLCIVKDNVLYETDFICDFDIRTIEGTPINFAKLLICLDDEKYDYITFNEFKKIVKLNS